MALESQFQTIRNQTNKEDNKKFLFFLNMLSDPKLHKSV